MKPKMRRAWKQLDGYTNMRKGFARNILVSLILFVEFSEVKRQEEVLSLEMMLISLKFRETLIPTTNPGDLFALTPGMSRGTDCCSCRFICV